MSAGIWNHINVYKTSLINHFKTTLLCLKHKQEVQGLQAFVFSVVTVNDEHTKLRFKRKRRGMRWAYALGVCAELYLKPWFESDCYFCNNTKSGWFWKRLFRKKVLNNFLQSHLRSSRTHMFFKIGVVRNFLIFTGEHLCWSFFLTTCNFI